jgi:hypothetical protein
LLDKKDLLWLLNHLLFQKKIPSGGLHTMAHKKIERKKELDRRRQRRQKRLKQRIKEAKEAANK